VNEERSPWWHPDGVQPVPSVASVDDGIDVEDDGCIFHWQEKLANSRTFPAPFLPYEC
jgi:hypothetical protein